MMLVLVGIVSVVVCFYPFYLNRANDVPLLVRTDG
jgi:hypothetical protein